MNTIIAKRCSFCGKPRVCSTLVTPGGDGVGICLACAMDALRLITERYHISAEPDFSTDLARGLADRKEGRMYPLREVLDAESLDDS